MISKKMEAALNEQVNKEFFSSYLYLSMAAYFEDKGLPGMANWMKLQAEEEHQHGTKFYEFIIKGGRRIKLTSIKEPKFEWTSPQNAFEESLAHEQFITKSINELTDLAIQEKDHATKTFLQWFVDEQLEEEATVQQIVESFKLVSDHPAGLFMLDRELGQRMQGSAE